MKSCVECLDKVMTGKGSEAICGLTGKELGSLSWDKPIPKECPKKNKDKKK